MAVNLLHRAWTRSSTSVLLSRSFSTVRRVNRVIPPSCSQCANDVRWTGAQNGAAQARLHPVVHCKWVSTSSSQEVMDKVNEEITNQPQSKLFAVVHIGGRQFKITPGDLIVVNRLTAEIGRQIFLDKVLLAGSDNFTIIGTPILSKELVQVKATVVEHSRAAKVIVFKKKRRKNYKRKKGHRQDITTLRINKIDLKPNLS